MAFRPLAERIMSSPRKGRRGGEDAQIVIAETIDEANKVACKPDKEVTDLFIDSQTKVMDELCIIACEKDEENERLKQKVEELQAENGGNKQFDLKRFYMLPARGEETSLIKSIFQSKKRC